MVDKTARLITVREAIIKSIVLDIIADLNDRSGLGIDAVDKDTQDEIKSTWHYIIDQNLKLLEES